MKSQEISPQLCGVLIDAMNTFYSDTTNRQKYEEWKKRRQEEEERGRDQTQRRNDSPRSVGSNG